MVKINMKSVNNRRYSGIYLLPTVILLFTVLLFLSACSSSMPTSYYDYEYERDYKVGIISDRLLEQIPAEIKRPVVLVVTSFVQLDDFSKTSRF
ncbi:MAG: hypothetical protein DRH03_03890, partial [Deltaproteobacteria bacterium]